MSERIEPLAAAALQPGFPRPKARPHLLAFAPAKPLEQKLMASSEPAELVSIEAELIKRALEGDGQAFARLVRPHLGLMFRLAMRACHNAAIAEDAVQESLAIAYRDLSRYQPGSSLRAYLTSIAIKRAHTLFRGEYRRRAREDAYEPPEQAATPLDLLKAGRTAELVRQALSAMPEKRREAAILRLDAGLSYAEIAQVIGSTEGSTRVLVHTALKELKEKLADLNPSADSGASPSAEPQPEGVES